MKRTSTVFMLSAVMVLFLFASCKKTDINPATSTAESSIENKMSENGANPDEAIFKTLPNATTNNHFYIESNKKSKNTILVFAQQQNGQLVLKDEVSSGGYGYGEALGSQSALAVSKNYNLLFAVNAGSGSISSFRINENTGALQLLFTASSNGQLPVSLSVHENKLFVLNAISSSICGYSFTPDGFLTKIEGAEHNLSAVNADGAQIKFQPDGAALYVTEKATNKIDKFILDKNGAVTASIIIQSQGVEPFGFDYARNNRFLVVSNAANGFSGAGSCTSYKFTNAGLSDVNGAVSNFETAPCWVATAKFGVFAFVSNTGTNNLSSYYIDANGALTLIKAVAAADGKAPIDIAVSDDNRFVYVIYSGSHTVAAYKRKPSGIIEFVDKVTTLPDFAAGLVTD
ncbi:MAG: beta-propeller fold lactonase family protein [Parafilimonas sp.]